MMQQTLRKHTTLSVHFNYPSWTYYSYDFEAIDWSPTGEQLAIAGKAGCLCVLKPNGSICWRSDKLFNRHPGSKERSGQLWTHIKAIQWSSNGQFIATCTFDNQIQVFDAQSHQQIWHFKGSSLDALYDLCWLPGQEHLLVACENGDLVGFKIGEKNSLWRWHTEEGEVNAVAWDTIQGAVVAGYESGALLQWQSDKNTPRWQKNLRGKATLLYRCAAAIRQLSCSHSHIAAATNKGLLLFDTLEQSAQVLSPTQLFTSSSWSFDGKHLAGLCVEDQIVLWNTKTWDVDASKHISVGWNGKLAFSPTTHLLGIAPEKTEGVIWSLEAMPTPAQRKEALHPEIQAFLATDTVVDYAYTPQNRLRNKKVPELRWRWELHKDSCRSSSIACEDGVLVFWDGDRLTALELSSRRMLWVFTNNGAPNPIPLTIEGVVYAVFSNILHAISLRSGEILWKTYVGNDVAGLEGYVSSGSLIFYTNTKNQIIALSSKSGEILWAYHWNEDFRINSNAIVADGILLFTNSLPQICAFDFAQKRVIWDQKIDSDTSLVVSDQKIIVFYNEYVGVYALSLKTGVKVWYWQNPDLVPIAPIIQGNTAVFLSQNGIIIGLDVCTGRKLWELAELIVGEDKKGCDYYLSPVTPTYACAVLGKQFILFNIKTGELLWELILPLCLTAAPRWNNQVLYCRTEQAILVFCTEDLPVRHMRKPKIHQKSQMWMGDLFHSGNYPPLQSSSPRRRLRWAQISEFSTEWGPLIYKNLVVAATAAAEIAAFEIQGGEERWRTKLLQPIKAPLTCTQGILFVGCDHAYLHALNPMTGELIWNMRGQGQWISGVNANDELVYWGDWENTYACEILTGALRWRRERLSSNSGRPLLRKRRLFIRSGDSIRAIDSLNGIQRWKIDRIRNRGSKVFLLIDDTLLWCHDSRAELHKTSKGELCWRSQKFKNSPIPWGFQDELIYLSADMTLYALVSSDGEEYWRWEGTREIHQVLLSGLTSLVLEKDATLSAISDIGELLWQIKLASSMGSEATLADDLLCFVDGAGNLLAIELWDRREEDAVSFQDASSQRGPCWREASLYESPTASLNQAELALALLDECEEVRVAALYRLLDIDSLETYIFCLMNLVGDTESKHIQDAHRAVVEKHTIPKELDPLELFGALDKDLDPKVRLLSAKIFGIYGRRGIKTAPFLASLSKDINEDVRGEAKAELQMITLPETSPVLTHQVNNFNGQLQWRRLLGLIKGFALSDGKDRVYCQTCDCGLFSLELASGKILWSIPTTSSYVSPEACNGLIFTGNVEGFVNARNQETGALIWRFQARKQITALRAYRGYLLVSSEDYRIYALDQRNGQLRWSFRGGSWFSSAATPHEEILYAQNTDHTLFALRLSDGGIIWQQKLGGEYRASPIVYQRALYIGGEQHLSAFSLMDGARLWRSQVYGNIESDVAASGGRVFGVTTRFGSEGTALYAFNADTGEKLWRSEIPRGSVCGPRLSGTQILLGASDEQFRVLEQSTGELIWRFQAKGDIRTSAMLAPDKILFASHDGYLYALS